MNRYADNRRVVLLELGIGYNTPAIIRYPFERVAYHNPQATIIRLNAEYPHGPAETASRTISFTENMKDVIDNLKILQNKQHE